MSTGVWTTCQLEMSKCLVRGTDNAQEIARLLSPDLLRSGRIRVIFTWKLSPSAKAQRGEMHPTSMHHPGECHRVAGGRARPVRDTRVQPCPALEGPAIINRKGNINIYVPAHTTGRSARCFVTT